MDTTELIKNSLDWADKRLDLKSEKLTKEQRNYITFALRQNLVKNIAVTHCCKSGSELLVCTYCGIQTNQEPCPHPKKCANKEKIKAN